MKKKSYAHLLVATAVFTGTYMGLGTTWSSRVFAAEPAAEPLVQYGDTGPAVSTLQNDLKAEGYINTVTGYFGSLTLAAVKQFQRDHGLAADGIVGPMTWQVLDQHSNTSPSSSSSLIPSIVSPPGTGLKSSSAPSTPSLGAPQKSRSSTSQGSGTASSGGACSGTSSSSTSSSSSARLGTSGSSTASSSTSGSSSAQSSLPKFTLTKKQIGLNGTVVSTAMGFTYQNTTFMPIWYVKPLLDKLGITSTWDGHNWKLVSPSTIKPNLSSLPSGASPYTISLNGIVVAHDTALPYTDPSTNQSTTFVPIWYLMQVLDRIQGKSTWNGTDWNLNLHVSPHVAFTAYQKNGTKIGTYSTQAQAVTALQAHSNPGSYIKDGTGKMVFQEPDFIAVTKAGTVVGEFLTEAAAQTQLLADGQPGGVVKDGNIGDKVVFLAPDFTAYSAAGKALGEFLTLSQAQALLLNSPGGTVKDGTGAVVYTAPDFAAYSGPMHAPTDYGTQVAAEAAIQNNPNGFVVNQQTKQIVQMPSDYYWVTSGGTWLASAGMPTLPEPGYAQPGQAFMNQTGTASSNQMFLLGQVTPNGSYTYVGRLVGGFDWVDLRFPSPSTVNATQIDSWLQANGSPLTGLGGTYIYTQNQYGVDATYLVAHSILESGWGKSEIAQTDNNLFGYGAYDSNPGYFAGKFPSDEYAIRFEAWEVRNNYLNPGSSHYYQWPTLLGMNHDYATSTTWASSIGQLMNQFVTQTNGSASDYVQYSPTATPPSPQSNQEPVYFLNGAKAVVTANPYTNLPMYPDWYTGDQQMFPGVLQIGSSGTAVQQLQSLLNQNGASLSADGQFGQMTQTALVNYQQSHQLPVTGIYDLATWSNLNNITLGTYPTVTQGTIVTIDQIIQGMLSGQVTEWFHIVTASGQAGWVDSNYLQFTNVYEVQPTSTTNTSVPLYTSAKAGAPVALMLHQGDYIVSNNAASPLSGYVQVLAYNQETGASITGYLSTTAADLVAVNPPSITTSSGSANATSTPSSISTSNTN